MGKHKEPCDLTIDATGFAVVLRGQVIGDIRWPEVARVEAANLDGLLLVRFSRTGSGGHCNIDSECGGFERVMGLAVERLQGFRRAGGSRFCRTSRRGTPSASTSTPN